MNKFLTEINEQPQALKKTVAWTGSEQGIEAMQQIRAAWMSGAYDKVVLTGMGSSFFLSHASALLLSGAAIPAFAVNAGEMLHFQRQLLTEKTLLVAISQSGESYEVVELLKEMMGQAARPLVVGITNEADSTLAKEADYALLCQAGKEDMTSTKTFITSYWIVWQLVEVLKGQTPVAAVGDELATEIQRLLDDASAVVPKAVAFLQNHTFVQLRGRGVDWATASLIPSNR